VVKSRHAPALAPLLFIVCLRRRADHRRVAKPVGVVESPFTDVGILDGKKKGDVSIKKKIVRMKVERGN